MTPRHADQAPIMADPPRWTADEWLAIFQAGKAAEQRVDSLALHHRAWLDHDEWFFGPMASIAAAAAVRILTDRGHPHGLARRVVGRWEG